jgi:hydrogenase nickel incorporation protein HypB
MCTTCGCGEQAHSVDGGTHAEPVGPHVGEHHHEHESMAAHSHAHGVDSSRTLRIEQDILAENAIHARANRRRLEQAGAFSVNLVASPGAGKTTLLVATLERLRGHVHINVIEGDQQTSNDADRIRDAGAPAVQINTGKGCHLDAHMVGHALDRLQPVPGYLFIENVGNLVCPAAFDLGESCRAVILSVTEGDDKPVKYPDMFAGSSVMVINKTDLLPYVDFDVDRCVELARRVNPEIEVIRLSARTGDGLERWLEWLSSAAAEVVPKAASAVEAP